jgi:uncharacterized Zn finger protein (UPF0148 family)
MASFELILGDSKPCPKCGMRITKISGCSDMFCVQCKTAFYWETMKIDRQGNSNPLYRNWEEEQRTLHDETGVETARRIRSGDSVNYQDYSTILELLFGVEGLNTNVNALREVERTRDLERLRVRYILGDITEQQWGHRIYLIDRDIRRDRYVADVVEHFIRESVNVVRLLVEIKDPGQRLQQRDRSTRQITTLLETCNQNLGKIRSIYQVPHWYITRSYNLGISH